MQINKNFDLTTYIHDYGIPVIFEPERPEDFMVGDKIVVNFESNVDDKIFAAYRFIEKPTANKAEIKRIKKEQTLICYALTACLNGLHQLGANGEVSTALEKMNKHLNQAAHDEE